MGRIERDGEERRISLSFDVEVSLCHFPESCEFWMILCALYMRRIRHYTINAFEQNTLISKPPRHLPYN